IPNDTLPDSPITISQDKSKLLLTTRKGQLISLNSVSGEKIWEKDFPVVDSSVFFQNRTIHFGKVWEVNNKIYVIHSPSNTFSSYNSEDGTKRWEITNIHFFPNKPFFKNDYILIKQVNKLISINDENGSLSEIKIDNSKIENLKIIDLSDEKESFIYKDKNYVVKISTDLNIVHWSKVSLSNLSNIKDISNNDPLLIQNYNIQKNITILDYVNHSNGEILKSDTLEYSPYIVSKKDNNNIITGNSSGHLISIDINELKVNFVTELSHKIYQIEKSKLGYVVFTEKSGDHIGIILVDFVGNIIWEYSPDFKANIDNLYYHDDKIYYTNFKEILLEKIDVSLNSPENQKLEKINFLYQPKVEYINPYLDFVPQENLLLKSKSNFNRFKLVIKNITKFNKFDITTKQNNSVFEIYINHKDIYYQNPFTDLKVTASITNTKTNEKQIIKGFYSERNTWKIHFLPQESSIYNISIKISTPFSYYKKDLSTYIDQDNYDPLTIKNHNFIKNDNTVFYPIGIQDAFFDRNFDGDFLNQMDNINLNKPGLDEDQYSYLNLDDYLKTFKNEAKINIFRYGVDNWSPSQWQILDKKEAVFSFKGGRFGDKLVRDLKNENYKILMTFFGFYPPFDSKIEINDKQNKKAIEKYLDYIIARYSAYVDLWEIGNEAQSSKDFYQFTTSYIKRNDPYQHPITTNWEEPNNDNFDFISTHHYQEPTQDGSKIASNLLLLSNFNNKDKTKPIFISELGFKDYSWFKNSSETMRIMSWVSVFQEMGFVFWNQGQNGIYENKQNANIYLGPLERSYLHSLQSFLPQLKYPTKTGFFVIDNTDLQVYSLQNSDYFLAYILNSGTEYSQKGFITIPSPVNTKIEIINPKTNTIIKELKTISENENILLPLIYQDLAIKAYINHNTIE
ncbi:MAG: DUF5060 domain-containing protein, partial [Candidatus Pacebacteria bacterium]|nr:DUF5060 domain-containing protein [Candidatus Paceibacterota bacterium]